MDESASQRLISSIKKGEWDEIKILLESAADPNFKSLENGNTAFHYLFCCAKEPDLEIVKILVENKANLNLPNKTLEKTPFHFALENENVSKEILQYLMEQNADLNSFHMQNARESFHHYLLHLDHFYSLIGKKLTRN